MAMAGFFELLITWGLNSWLPLYGVQQLKLSLLLAGSLLSVFHMGELVGIISGGILSDKVFGAARTPIWLLGGITTSCVITWIATFRQGVPLGEVYVAFTLVGFFIAWTPIGQLFAPYLAELLTPGAVGRSLGAVMLGAFVGSALAQPLIARLIIQTPAGPQYWPVFVMFGVSGVLTSSCVAGMIEPRVGRTYLGYLLSGKKALVRKASQAS
jgi:sugar phosphate permease